MMGLIKEAAKELAKLLDPVAKVLRLVRDLVAKIDKFIQDFVAALSQNLVARCVLEIFEPVSDVINLVTCPVDEAVAASFHFVIDELMDEIVNLVNRATNEVITKGVDALVPDDLDITIPDFKKFLPSEVWLATCAAASAKFPDHAHLIRQVSAVKFPYRVTGKTIESAILAQALPRAQLTRFVPRKYESACVDAFKEMGTDYKACATLSYPRGAGQAMKPEGCRSGYDNTGLMCSRCSGDWRPWTWKCHTYTQKLRCVSHLENDASLCYTPCRSGYKGAGPVCWLQ